MKQKKAKSKSSKKNNKNNSVDNKFKKKENNEPFKITDISESSTYNYNSNKRPISFIFKKEPNIVKLVESITTLQQLNSNELDYYEEENYDKTLIENIVNCIKLIKGLNIFLNIIKSMKKHYIYSLQ